MESRTKLFGHALHPVLIVFPLGLLVTAVVFDVIYLITDREAFAQAAAFIIAAGIIGGFAAGLFGLIDWLAIPKGTRAKGVGLFHGAGNVVVLLLFAVSWLLRRAEDGWEPTGLALALGFVGVVLGGVTGWLGGELVERLGVGVDEGANLDAPNSLAAKSIPAAARRHAGPSPA
jgi:uncharacterized membrane protein